MNTTHTAPMGLPPIQANLVDALMQHADSATSLPQTKRARSTIPDFTAHTAKLTLVLFVVCLYVRLITYIGP